MGYLVRAYYSISSTRYYKDDSCWNEDVKSKTTEDIISNRILMEVLVLNHYVLVKNVFIMGEPLSPGRVFNFPVYEPEPHPAYDFFVPGPLPGYAGNLNNNNGWIEADVPLLGELRVVADEPTIGPIADEIVEPIVEAEEQGLDEGDVWKVNEEWLMALVTPPLMPAVPSLSVYEVGGPSTAAAEGLSFLYPALGLPVPPSVIENLSNRLGIGFASSSAAKGFTDSAIADYGFGDE
nr:hypothetical protein [Tanacetum cinerariifolium]